MKMKLALITSLLTTSGFSLANNGNVNFNGQIIDAACTVTPATANQTVNLGKVSKNSFTAPFNTSAATAFQIDLTACPANLTNAAMKFDGTPYQGDNRMIELIPEAGSASGLGVQIRTNDNVIIPLFYPHKIVLSPGATTSIKFKAVYVARSATITPGKANAIATFNIVYN